MSRDPHQPEPSAADRLRKARIRIPQDDRDALARAANRARTARRRQRSRPSRLRVFVWALEAVVFLAVLEHFVIRRHILPHRQQPAPAAPRTIVHGDPIPPLGAAIAPLRGLVEVQPAYRAHLDGLAPGSRTMAETQISVSRQYGLPVEAENRFGMRFRLIPPGTAFIGSPEDEPGRGEVEVQHVRAIPRPFYLGTFEVTQRQWQTVMGTSPSRFKGAQHPVEEVTWYDCQTFTLALCEADNLPKGTYRLPTEAEWEYACRAGTTTAYHFGNDPARLRHYADYAGNNYESTSPVGSHLPNALGLYDMHGNVWEWCLDRFRPFPGDDTDLGEKAAWRAIRGGNWYVPADRCRSANRCRLPPGSHGNMLGFRVLRALPEISMGAPPPDAADVPEPTE